jgi:hypothetical protein
LARNTMISEVLLESILAANPMIERYYLAGGGSLEDLHTDMSHALASAVITHVWRTHVTPATMATHGGNLSARPSAATASASRSPRSRPMS